MATSYDDLATQVYTAFNNADYGAIDRLFADDYVEHDESPGVTRDREGVKQFVRMIHEGFPDVHFTPEEVLSAPGRVAVRFRMTGTNTGAYMGAPATGRALDVRGIDMAAITPDGRVREHWGYLEETKMMQQLGAIPGQRTVDVTERTRTST